MQEWCPLCLQNDKKSKIKLLQINFEDAIWSCESVKCTWPFGYENFTYFSRKVGKTWSYHWDDYSPKNTFEHDVASLKETPALATANDNFNDVFDTKDTIIKSEKPSDYSLQIKHENLTDILEKSNDRQAEEKYKIEKNTSDIKAEDLYFDTTNDNKDSIDFIKDIKIPIKEENKAIAIADSFKNVPEVMGTTRSFPQITSIEKTNINICTVCPEGQVSMYSTRDNGTKHCVSNPKNENLQTKPVMYITIGTNGNISSNITKQPMTKVLKKINPPRLQSKQINQSQSSTVQLNQNALPTYTSKGGSLKALKAQLLQSGLCQPIKKLSSGKEYEKFSFSVIKKQMEKKEKTPTNNITITSNSLQDTNATIGRDNMASKEINEVNISRIKQDPLPPESLPTNTNESPNVISCEQGIGSVLIDEGTSIKTEEDSNIDTKSEFPCMEGITLNETNYCNNHQFAIDDMLKVDHSITENPCDDWLAAFFI